ncbi:peptidoglycan-binding protein LysM [Lacihabitans sp. CS3-21]|jgi:nucleoid-associated protein YgaU|uniref:peptidoglycan-binding protein LysM n=1 Tax=Lacihabitans sp. CS3-21 TaxID=2487332 RepID=UPI000BC36CC7|nr:peptidoglycan-binding protein LysM [Lacihabitans sp. CS3-21]MCP9747693.1 peptidoglycan-binding protein LysM [Lacihabitans sp. CS3-21]OYU66524.1 MAG: peptidoglycan-binding protein LysM [Cytophagaceae bacterium BCCC1]
MGLMSFFKGVGEKLFGKSEAEVADKTPELKASALLAHVQGLGLEFKALTVKVNGDTVTISGEVETQEQAEKIALAVGNVEGVEAVDNQMVVSSPAPEARYHTVEKGDSLSKIAKEMYGDPMKYPVIFEANKPMLKDPDLIYPGQVLRIPEL